MVTKPNERKWKDWKFTQVAFSLATIYMSNVAHNRTKNLLLWWRGFSSACVHVRSSLQEGEEEVIDVLVSQRWLLLVTCASPWRSLAAWRVLNQRGLPNKELDLLHQHSSWGRKLPKGSPDAQWMSAMVVKSIRLPRRNGNEVNDGDDWKRKKAFPSFSLSLRDDSFDSKWNLSSRLVRPTIPWDLLRDARTMTCQSQEPQQRRLPFLSGVPPSIQGIEWDLNVL
jgi:hypothetical protein